MPELELSSAAQHWVNVVLIWVGFGTLAGLLAMLVLPFKQPANPAAALMLGIVGSMVGLMGLSWLLQGKQYNPISPMGFIAATIGAFVILVVYRGCASCFVGKDEEST